MLLIGAMFFRVHIHGKPITGALLSIIGVLLVFSRGSLQQLLAFQLVAGFFVNLTPLFTALLSSAILGELPQYHVLAFVLIVAGIVISSRQQS